MWSFVEVKLISESKFTVQISSCKYLMIWRYTDKLVKTGDYYRTAEQKRSQKGISVGETHLTDASHVGHVYA